MQLKHIIFIFSVILNTQATKLLCEILNVGQGSANFLTLENEKDGKIVVIFDAGSSSSFIHRKFVPLTDDTKIWGEYYEILKSKTHSPTNTKEIEVFSRSDSSSSSVHSIREDPETLPKKAKYKIEDQQISYIKNKLNGAAQCWFIISHADKDHINYVDSILEEINKMKTTLAETKNDSDKALKALIKARDEMKTRSEEYDEASTEHENAQAKYKETKTPKDEKKLKSALTKLDDAKWQKKEALNSQKRAQKEHDEKLKKYKQTKQEAENILPKRIFAVLGGDWFTNPKFKKSSCAIEVKNTLRALVKANAKIIMPHYLANLPRHEKIVEHITAAYDKDDDSKKLIAAYDLGKKSLEKKHFSGSLRKLAETFGLESADIPDVLRRRLRFWGLNNGTDPNSQSIIASYTDIDNNISFIFTGDAEESTFQALQKQIDQYNVLRKLQLLTNDKTKTEHLIFMTVPHHGSHKNISPSAYATFMPDGYIFSAGDGAQHGHPDRETYDAIITDKTNTRANEWSKRLKLLTDLYIPLFTDRYGNPRFKCVNRAPFIFLSTQTIGNIIIEADGADVITIKGQNKFTSNHNGTIYREHFQRSIGKDGKEKYTLNSDSDMSKFIDSTIETITKVKPQPSMPANAKLYSVTLKASDKHSMTAGDIMLVAKTDPRAASSTPLLYPRLSLMAQLEYDVYKAEADIVKAKKDKDKKQKLKQEKKKLKKD